jgi:CheY-like chemotaxis protein
MKEIEPRDSDWGLRSVGEWRGSSAGTSCSTVPWDMEVDLQLFSLRRFPHDQHTQYPQGREPNEGELARNRLVLLVEDDRGTAAALSSILQRRGFEVVVANTVAQGTQMLEKNPATLILDLMLPDGDGISILRHVRANELPIRVLVTTGISDPQRLAAVRHLGPELLLKKPIDLEELLRSIEPVN